MKRIDKKSGFLILLAVAGLILMLWGFFSPKKDSTDTKDILEAQFEQAIAELENIDSAKVIIKKDEGKITGAIAVCSGGGDKERENVTNLLSSGLDLPSNKIYVVCN